MVSPAATFRAPTILLTTSMLPVEPNSSPPFQTWLDRRYIRCPRHHSCTRPCYPRCDLLCRLWRLGRRGAAAAPGPVGAHCMLYARLHEPGRRCARRPWSARQGLSALQRLSRRLGSRAAARAVAFAFRTCSPGTLKPSGVRSGCHTADGGWSCMPDELHNWQPFGDGDCLSRSTCALLERHGAAHWADG